MQFGSLFLGLVFLTNGRRRAKLRYDNRFWVVILFIVSLPESLPRPFNMFSISVGNAKGNPLQTWNAHSPNKNDCITVNKLRA
eukprot:5607215-Amphidinium_carterae.1